MDSLLLDEQRRAWSKPALPRQTAIGVELPFEVMSVAEFENAIHVLGVKRLVSLIRGKWHAGHVGLPLGIYFSKVLGENQRRVSHVRNNVELEDRELFLNSAFRLLIGDGRCESQRRLDGFG